MSGRSRGMRAALAVISAVSSLSLSLGSVESAVASPVASKPNTEIVMSIASDGTAGFDTDPIAPSGSPVAHTPGLDGGANNGVVRTKDSVQYRVDWNVNEVDATAVVLTASLPTGMAWTRDATGAVAPGCAQDAGGSSISADGLTWTCVIGDRPQGTAGAIFPVATVVDRLNDDVVPVTASIDTAQTTPVTSNSVSVTVSATVKANWVKDTPEEILDVDNGGVMGRLYIYPIYLVTGNSGGKGGTKLDDSYAYSFYDNAWGLANGAILAPQAIMDIYAPGRRNCGGYDGAGEYPYGRLVAGKSDATNTTLGAQAGGTWTCTDGSSTDFSVKMDVAGQVTSAKAPKNANAENNTRGSMITGQIAWWVPESELRARAGAPATGSFATGLNLGNSISATQAAITYPANPAQTLIAPAVAAIAVKPQGSPPGVEVDISDNTVAHEATFSASMPGTRKSFGWTRFLPGPYKEALTKAGGHSPDLRGTALGGMGRVVLGANEPWDGLGTAARDEVVTIETGFAGVSSASGSLDFAHTCTGVDTDNLELVAFPATFPLSVLDVSRSNAKTVSTSSISSNQGPLAHAYAGGQTGNGISPLDQAVTGSFFLNGPLATVGVKVQFAHAAAGYKATPPVLVGNPDTIDPSNAGSGGTAPPTGDVDANVDTAGLSCNNNDADSRGWVDSTADLSVFDTDGNGRYEGINLIRVSSTEPLDWSLNSQMVLSLQAQVKRDRPTNPNGAELYVHMSRAISSWNQATENGPQVGDYAGTCQSAETNSKIDDDAIGLTGDARLDKNGWCGLPYNDANEGAGLDPNAADDSSVTLGQTFLSWGSDKITIVEARPAISKVNDAGLQQYVRSGDLVNFTLRPRIIGSSADTVTNVTVTDTLPAGMTFVSSSVTPASVVGQVVTWNFGDQPGGWAGPAITVTALVGNAAANSTLSNKTEISAVKSGASAPTVVSAYAFAYTGPAYRESRIVKDVLPMQGVCQRYPEVPGSATFPAAVATPWQDNCSMTELDGRMSFQVSYTNTGSENLTDFSLIDVFPHNGDATEIQDAYSGSPDSAGAGNDGDGRTPPSAFSGTVGFDSIAGLAATDTVLYTADPAASISRDPQESRSSNTWCTAPAGGTKTFGTGTCPSGNATVTGVMVRRPTLTPGGTQSFSLRMTTLDNECDDLYTNNVGAHAMGTAQTAPTPTATNLVLEQRSNDVSVLVQCKIDLALTKKLASSSTAPFYVGSKVTFDVEVTNQGDQSVDPVTVSDYVPAGFIYKAADNASDWGAVDVTGPGSITRVVTGPIAPLGTKTVPVVLEIAANVTAPQDLVNRAEVSRFDTDNDLTTGDSFSQDTLDVPGDARLTFRDSDSTPDTSSTNDLGGVPGGPTDDLITNTPTSAVNPDEDDADPAQITVSPGIDLELAKTTVSAGPYFAGSTVTYELTPKNNGPATAKAGWSVTEIMPAGLTLVSMSGTGYTCATLPTCVAGSSLASGASGAKITVTATIDAAFTGQLHNVAYVSPEATDVPESNLLVLPDTTTNTSTSATNNDAQADIAVGSLVSVGNYTWIDKNNNGQQDAGEVPLKDVQVFLELADGTPVRDTITDAAGFYSFADLTPGTAYQLRFEPPAGYSFTTATTGASATDSNPNASSGIATFTAPASGVNSLSTPDDPTIDAGFISVDLTLAKAETSTAPYYAGSTVTYSLTPSNIGSATAKSGWSVTEVLPAGLTMVSMSGTGYDCSALPTCVAAGTLAAGATGNAITVTATVNVPFSGPVHNVAYISPAATEIPESILLVVPNTSTDTSTTATNNDAQDDLTVTPLVSVGDFVWVDTDRDGIQDAGEPGKSGVTVTLKDGAGTVVATTTTDAAGFYSFTDLLPSTAYTITFTPPAEYKFTLQAQGSDNKLDSNAAPATGIATLTTPATGTNSATSPDVARVDAGLITKTYAVGDYVWYDTDRDGVQDAGESPVAGVKVRLLLSDGSPATDATGVAIPVATTDAAGKYVFDLVPAGTYQVRFFGAPAGATFTTTTGGTNATNSNPVPATGITPVFTLSPTATGVRAASAADGVAADYVNPTIDAGLLRIDLELTKALTATGPFYSGSTVTYELTPKNNGPVDALAGWTVTDVLPSDLSLVSMLGTGYTCTGAVCTADDGLAAGATGPVITVTATVKKPFDGAAKNVAYISPAPGETGESNVLVVPTAATDTAASPTNNDAQADLTVLPLVSVGDYVWQDNDRDGVQDATEPGVKDVTVTLKDASGTEIATTTTDADGFYSFVDLKSGLDYTVTFTPPANTTLTLKEVAAGTEATDSDADPATGVAAFTAPASGTNSATTADLPSVDAGIVPKTFAVSNFVWYDANRDGIQDAGELPVEGVTVTLINPDGSPAKNLEGNEIAAVLTDADGLYVIDDVPAGSYQVKFSTLPSGATFTSQGVGAADTDSTPAVTNGTTGTFALGATATNVRAVETADGTLVASFINPTIDAGILLIDLELAKAMTATGPFYSGSTVTYELAPKNNGPVDALAGYKVTDILPSDLTLVTMSGAGYACTGAVCTADDGLAAGATGPVITVTATVNKPFDGAARNLAYISPATGETGESNLLVIPTPGTDTLLSTTNNDAQADLTVAPLVSVGDYVWQDNDRDGVQDASEPPVQGVIVTLKDAAGATIASTTTDADGFYSFVDLKSGLDYTIAFTPPANTVFTVKDAAAGTEATDSDVNRTTGEVLITAPATGSNSATAPDRKNVDAGITPKTFAVSNIVWLDTNRDGIQDAGELPVEGVTVTLVNPDGTPAKDLQGNPIAAVLTDADGLYVIDDVPAGDYQVKFTTLPTGATFTQQGAGTAATDSTPNPATGTTGTFTLSPTGPNVRAVDGADGTLVAAFINPTIDAGILSLDLALTKTLTATGPFYAGSTVTYELTPKNNGPVDAIAGWKVTEVLPTELTFVSMSGSGYTCSGEVCTADAGLAAGASGPVIIVTAKINKFFKGDARNVAYISPATGETGEAVPLAIPAENTDTSTTTTNNDAHADLIVDPLISVGDYVWRDTNRDGIQDPSETPLEGITVTLYDAAGTKIADTVTGPGGFYSFEDLLPGTDYQLEFVVPDGMKLSPTGAGTAATDSDPDPATGKVAFTTDADGSNSLTSPDMPGLDAGLIPKTFAVSNFVWYDTNRDGIQDAGELPVEGVTVTLVNPDGSPAKDLEGNEIAAVQTDADGLYVIDDIPAGDYQVKFSTLPTGAKLTTAGVGADATDSTPNASTGTTGTFTLGLAATNVRDVAAADGTLVAEYVNPTIDAGVLLIDLELAKTVTSTGPYYAGSTVTFELAPKNNGPVDALTGWSVTDVLPTGLTLVTMSGSGYSCTGSVCTADDGLAAGADGPVIIVTAKINKFFKGDATNVAYVSPVSGEVGESNVLAIPAADTDASGTATNNDASAPITVDPLISVGDYLWRDANRDGIQDAGETPVQGVTVTLFDASGTEIATTTTDASGFYSFEDLLPGTDYQLGFTVPAGMKLSPTGAGTAATDSDPDPATGKAAFTTDADGNNSLTAPDMPGLDAGLIPKTFAVSNFVWYDTNRDGIQDASELPVAGVTVTLVNPDGSPAKDLEGNEIAAVQTDADGLYVIDDVPAGDYQVKFSTLPTGAKFTTAGVGADATDSTPNASTGTTGTFTLGLAATNVRDVAAADGTLVAEYVNPTIDAGVLLIDLELAKTVTSTGPYYAGSTVTFELAPKNNGPVDALTGWSVTEIMPPGMTLVSMTGAGYTCVEPKCTATAGLASGADGPVITVTAKLQAGFKGDATNVAYISPSAAEAGETNPLDVPDSGTDTGGSGTNNDASAPIYVAPLVSVGDQVFLDKNRDGIQDAGEPGYAGVKVTLYDASGAVVATTTTDANGFYSFTGLKSATDYEIGFTAPTGTKFSPAGAGTPATDSDPDPATGKVSFTTPADGNDTATSPDLPTIDAGLIAKTFAVGDYVWADADRDGIQDAGEKPVAGVTVQLQNPDGSPAVDANGVVIPAVQTNAAGFYLFDDVPAGSYRVAFSTLPAAQQFTKAGAGTSATDSTAIPSTGITPVFALTFTASDVRPATATDVNATGGALTAEYVNPTIDAGITPIQYAVSNRVFKDLDQDGVQDPGEPGLPGITVQLLDATGAVVATTKTNTKGEYAFDTLAPGTYQVKFSNLPFDYKFSPQEKGTDPAKDSTVDATGLTKPFEVGPGAPNQRPTTTADGLTASVVNPTIDAGLIQPLYSIKQSVWIDADRDGIRDPGEKPVAGVTVKLLDATGKVVATTTTDSNGKYTFDKLVPGTYRVAMTGFPEGYSVTGAGKGKNPNLDSDVNAKGVSALFKVGPTAAGVRPATASDGVKANFVDPTVIGAGILPPQFAVGSRVWNDANGNGRQDAGEKPLVGVKVTLLDANGNVVAATSTNAQGSYRFDNLPAGKYRIKFSNLPNGYMFTYKQRGSDRLLDSNSSGEGITDVFTLAIGAPGLRTATDADGVTAGYFLPGIDAGAADASVFGLGREQLGRTGGSKIPIALLGGGTLLAAGGTLIVAAKKRRNQAA